MRTLSQLLNLTNDVTINVKGESTVLISKSELVNFITRMHSATFTNRSRATSETGISYLGSINGSAKVIKGYVKEEMFTYIMYLSPYKNLFGNVCAMGEHCADPCLNTSGRVKMDIEEFKILRARYFRTVLFYVNRDYFNAWLFAEIDAHSKRLGDKLVVRLNGTSDLSPKLFKVNGQMVLDAFPDVQFYDYTKIPSRMDMHQDNYHITFSYSGYNQDDCDKARAKGINVSIVVDGPQPKTWRGIPVFSMDKTDLRSFDVQKGQYGYLKLKETLNKGYDTKFVIDQDDLDYDQLITSLTDAILEPSVSVEEFTELIAQ